VQNTQTAYLKVENPTQKQLLGSFLVPIQFHFLPKVSEDIVEKQR
jgi:hypothetical protein